MEPDKKEPKKKVAPAVLRDMKESQERICGIFVEIEGWVYDLACLN